MTKSPLRVLIPCFLALCAISCSDPGDGQPLGSEDFVHIPETFLPAGGDSIRVAAFDIGEHVVTNKEYAQFLNATGYPAPIHFEKGKIPRGFEEYPVIYVNREDADAYVNWLSEREGRQYALPGTNQYVAASRRKGGKARYFWGDDDSLLHPDSINYDSDGSRLFDNWKEYLKPAKWGMRNAYGLYGMAGNVWQLTQQLQDPAVSTFKYRIEKLIDLERTLMGGSWARGPEYLAFGMKVSQSPGLKAPDVGIRLVREAVSGTWKTVNRKPVAVNTPEGNVAVSWAVLRADTPGTRYNVYRIKSGNRDSDGLKVNAQPLAGSSLLDTVNLLPGARYQYRVAAVAADGQEGASSDWTGVTVATENAAQVVTFSPVYQLPGFTPVFGDLEGYGQLGCVIRLANGNTETSQDPGHPVQLEAFTSFGRSLWRKDIAVHGNIYGSASNCPFNVWDMDNDGRAEVITLLQIGEVNYVAILDGMSGRVKFKTPWPEMASDVSRSSTRIQLSVGYLDGKNPAIITQTGIYENEVLTAYDAQLNHLWTYNSFGATNGSGGHKIEIADVDGDGRQEVVYGTTCLNWDGTLRWSIYRQHPDIISVQDYLPDNPGLEVFYLVESSIHAGAYLVDADSGKVLWKNNREDDRRWSHGHAGWTADIWDGSPGMECVVNRAGHNDRNFVVFSSAGAILQEPFPAGYLPFEWDGDNTRELIGQNGFELGNWDGKNVVEVPGVHPNPIQGSRLIYTADLYGDFRDELVVLTKTPDGKDAITVVTAPGPLDKRYIAPSEDIFYRLWLARNMGGGYRSVYDTPYRELEE